MNEITLGRYIPISSPLHRLDPRGKILSMLAMIVACFLPYTKIIAGESGNASVTYWTLTGIYYGIMFLFCLVLFIVGHLSFGKVFSSMKSLWFTMLLLLVIYCLVPNASTPTLGVAFRVEQMNWTVYWDSFAGAGRILIRLILLLMLTFVLTSTTKPLDLTYAFEWYLTPLKVFHFPTAEVAMTMSIALRFIPTLLDDVSRISKAQASRGAAFQKGGFKRKIVGITSLIIPLFVSAFLRSEDLANAMICRAYDPKAKRTRYRVYKLRFSDIAATVFCLAFLGLSMALCITHFDPISSWFGVSLP